MVCDGLGALRGRALDIAEVVGRQLDASRPEVFLQAVQFSRARDGHEPRLLREDLREGHLSGSRLFALGDPAEEADYGLIRL